MHGYEQTLFQLEVDDRVLKYFLWAHLLYVVHLFYIVDTISLLLVLSIGCSISSDVYIAADDWYVCSDGATH